MGVTGNFFIDEEVVLTKLGLTVKDLDRYAVTPGIPLMPDAYVGDVAQFTLWSEAGKLANAVASTVGALFKGTA